MCFQCPGHEGPALPLPPTCNVVLCCVFVTRNFSRSQAVPDDLNSKLSGFVALTVLHLLVQLQINAISMQYLVPIQYHLICIQQFLFLHAACCAFLKKDIQLHQRYMCMIAIWLRLHHADCQAICTACHKADARLPE